VGLFPSSGETVRIIHSLGSLERVKLNHWIFQGYYFHKAYHHYLASQRSVRKQNAKDKAWTKQRVTGGRKKYVTGGFIAFTLHQILLWGGGG
jgi:hypothetical protein